MKDRIGFPFWNEMTDKAFAIGSARGQAAGRRHIRIGQHGEHELPDEVHPFRVERRRLAVEVVIALPPGTSVKGGFSLYLNVLSRMISINLSFVFPISISPLIYVTVESLSFFFQDLPVENAPDHSSKDGPPAVRIFRVSATAGSMTARARPAACAAARRDA